MPHNYIKKYPDLLELSHFNERDRKESLRAIFDRDVTFNNSFKFIKKQIRPTKLDGEPDLSNVFNHLISEDFYFEDENGKTVKRRELEIDRSKRLHWIKVHIETKTNCKIEVFSVEERDKRKRKNVIRTYLLNIKKKYVIVLEPQKSGLDYFLITAYYLNKGYGLKQLKKKMKKKMDYIY